MSLKSLAAPFEFLFILLDTLDKHGSTTTAWCQNKSHGSQYIVQIKYTYHLAVDKKVDQYC